MRLLGTGVWADMRLRTSRLATCRATNSASHRAPSSAAVHVHPDRIAAGLGTGRAPRMRALAGGTLGAHALEVAAGPIAAAVVVGAGCRIGAGEAQDLLGKA